MNISILYLHLKYFLQKVYASMIAAKTPDWNDSSTVCQSRWFWIHRQGSGLGLRLLPADQKLYQSVEGVTEYNTV